ncbi:MAG: hypothetical protein RLZZ22_306 [Pseudomonadota bacterium]|jgi:osmotically-inducible protein OsmY
MKISYSATLALTLAALGLSMAHAGETEIAAKARQTMTQEMGTTAKDMTVAIDGNGVATLQGWAQEPKDVSQARYLVSRVEGVKAAYGSGVRTWSSTNKY